MEPLKLLTAGIIGIIAFVTLQILNKEAVNKNSKRLGILLQLLWLVRFFLIYVKLDTSETTPAFYIIYDQTLILLDGPLFWLYTRSLVNPKGIKLKDALHFIPFLLLFIYSTYLLIVAPEVIIFQYQTAIDNMLDGNTMADFSDSIFIVLVLGLSLFYIFKAVNIAKVYNQSLLDNYSSVENRTANWIITFQRLWIGLFFIPIFIYFILYIFPFLPTTFIAGAVLISIVSFSLFFNYKLLNQSYVSPKSLTPKKEKNTLQSIQPDNNQTELLNKLKRDLQHEKYYLDEELSLNKLAKYIDLKSAELTELIKLSEYDNFYDLINSHRIEEIKKELIETEEQIIVLAYQNGFKSKSTFNKIFKEKTGLTPKQFRNSKKSV
jgi:AraC-like DNA-binding protein